MNSSAIQLKNMNNILTLINYHNYANIDGVHVIFSFVSFLHMVSLYAFNKSWIKKRLLRAHGNSMKSENVFVYVFQSSSIV